MTLSPATRTDASATTERKIAWLAIALTASVLVVTGSLLLLSHSPSDGPTTTSIEDFGIPTTMMVRHIHQQATRLLLALVALHLVLSLVLSRSIPRRSFITGGALLVLVAGTGLSGYLMPWGAVTDLAVLHGSDQAASQQADSPFAELLNGPGSHRYDTRHQSLLLRKPAAEAAWLRFRAVHCVGLPLVTALLVALHWRVRRPGAAE